MAEFNWLTALVFPYINFILFVFILWRVSRKPANDAARKRKDDYEVLYKKASASYDVAKKRLSTLTAKLATLEAEITQIKEHAEKNAQKQARAAVSEAEKMSEYLAREAQQLAQREASHAKELLQEELWDKAKEALVERLRAEFTLKKQKDYLVSVLPSLKGLKK